MRLEDDSRTLRGAPEDFAFVREGSGVSTRRERVLARSRGAGFEAEAQNASCKRGATRAQGGARGRPEAVAVKVRRCLYARSMHIHTSAALSTVSDIIFPPGPCNRQSTIPGVAIKC